MVIPVRLPCFLIPAARSRHCFMTEASPSQISSSPAPASHAFAAAGVLGPMVLMAALLGIWARPMGFLSVIWPANALLLGTLLHRPAWLRPVPMLAAFAGYVCADLMTGSRPEVAVLLSAANMAGVGAAWLFMHRRSHLVLFMQRQTSALLLFTGSGLAALVASAIGGPVLTVVFQTPPWQALSMWLSSEWLNYMIVLPPMLAWPTRRLQRSPAAQQLPLLLRAIPLLLVVALEIISYWLGGPGALAFSLPALLWCALSYRVFTLTLITSALCVSKMLAISLGSFEFTPAHFLESVSFRIGLCMLVLGPLAVASAHAARAELLRQLRHAVNHDMLTDVLARGAFLSQGQRLLDRCAHDRQPVAVLMLDLDHFKQVNDSYGHAVGDQLLRSFGLTLTRVLRPQDLVGRMGGEEFAVLLPQVDRITAQKIARRINQATRELELPLAPDSMSTTVSIGMLHAGELQPQQSLDLLLHQADQALYAAKAQGRDRYETRLWSGPGNPALQP